MRRLLRISSLSACCVVIALASSCSSKSSDPEDPVTEENFDSKLLAELCKVAPCCADREVPYDEAGCRKRWTEALEARGAPGVDESFDPDLAAKCLSALRDAYAQCKSGTDALSGVCFRVWSKHAKAGQACSLDRDCADVADGLTACTGTCSSVVRGTSGSACQATCTLALGESDRVGGCLDDEGNPTGLDPAGAVCLASDGLECVSGACAQVAGWTGASCASEVGCAAYHYCDASGLCVLAAEAGRDLPGYLESCSSSKPCSEPYRCVYEGAAGRCSLPDDVTALDCSGSPTSVEPY